MVDRLDEKQEAERTLLVELLDGCQGDALLIASAMTQLECQEKLQELSLKFGLNKERKILEEAANIAFELRRKYLLSQDEAIGDVDDENIKSSLLADLQQKQDEEVAKTITDIQEMVR